MPPVVLFDRYRVLRVLGGGGMSEVLLGVDLRDGAQVALKRLHAHVAKQPGARAQFEREATALRECAAPTVVPLREAHFDAPEALLVLDYVPGADLRPTEEDRRDALPLALRVLETLALLHARGWVHGDVHPGNIRALHTPVGATPSLVLLDFGVALRSHDAVPLPGALRGTLGYMAPEVILGAARAEPGCDVFAVGVMLWQWLAQRRLFEGLEVVQMQQTVERPAPPLGRAAVLEGVDLGPWLGALLERDPTRRYADARVALDAYRALRAP